jgi:hypothetical protein
MPASERSAGPRAPGQGARHVRRGARHPLLRRAGWRGKGLALLRADRRRLRRHEGAPGGGGAVRRARDTLSVALLRDEAANLGWAAELRVESAAGRTVDRAALARAALAPAPGASGDAWRYRLATPVPDHFVPLVPVKTADGGLSLRRGLLAMAVDGGDVATSGAIGTILEPDGPLAIHDEEIPATGATVTRTWQMARTGSGGLVLWVGRRKSAGRPRRSPGLGFDLVVTAP